MRSPAGFHIVKLHERRGAAVDGAPVAQTRLRHILIEAAIRLSESEALRRLNDLRERIIKSGADFAEDGARARTTPRPRAAASSVERTRATPCRTSTRLSGSESRRGQPAGAHAVRLPPHSGARRRSADMSPSGDDCGRARRCASARRTRPIRTGCGSCATRCTSASAGGTIKAPGRRAHFRRAGRNRRSSATRSHGATSPPTSS